MTRRRVAEQADGWMPMPSARGSGGVPLETLEDLTDLLAYLHAHAASVGRTTPIDVMCVLPGPAADAADASTIDTVKRLAEDVYKRQTSCSPARPSVPKRLSESEW